MKSAKRGGVAGGLGALLLVVGTVLAPQASAQPGEGPGPETNPLITTAPVLPPPESAPMPVSTAFAEMPPKGGWCSRLILFRRLRGVLVRPTFRIRAV